MQEIQNKAQKIRCLICDFDGVMTDGRILIDNQGNEFKAFNLQDGFGIKLLQAADIEVAIITGSRQTVIDHRIKQLNIKYLYRDTINKQKAYSDLKSTLGLQDEEIAYIGDDLPDLAIMQKVGLSIAVANAVKQIKENANWQTKRKGGQGAIREACDFILEAQGCLNEALQRFLSDA